MNWIKLGANWYVILLNLLKLLKISSTSDLPIHTVERIKTASNLFRINSMKRMLGNPTV